MQLHGGSLVRVWDDDRACWREGEVTSLGDDDVEVTVLNGDHPLHMYYWRRHLSAPRSAETHDLLDPLFRQL